MRWQGIIDVALWVVLTASSGAGRDLGQCELAFTTLEGKSFRGADIDVPVDTRGTWTIIYTAGEQGMAEGGGIWLKKLGWWDFNFGLVKQAEDPEGEDYVTCESDSTTGKVIHAVDDLGRYFKEQNMLHAEVTEGELKPGDTIVFRVGDRRQGGKGTLTEAVAWDDRHVYVQIDLDGRGRYVNLPEPLRVSFKPNEAARLEVVAPSRVAVGEAFNVLVRVEDQNCNLQPAYKSRMRGMEFPEITRDAGSAGQAEMDADAGITYRRGRYTCPMKAVRPGVVYLWVRDGKLAATSNPIQVVEGQPDRRLYWGDTHVHTYQSDGTDDLDANYEYARDITRLDFTCASDHLKPTPEGARQDSVPTMAAANNIWKPMTNEQWWQKQLDAADRFHDPHKFVTYYAYEWSGGSRIGGDHIPIMTERHELPAPYELNDLYRFLEKIDRGNNVMIIPHVGGRIGNWDWHSPQVEVAAEIASVHGHFEWFAQEALQRGYKVAFMGAGDNHYGRPGHSIWARFGRHGIKERRTYGLPNPITGCYAQELTRTGVVEAFRQRRIFATTGHRPILEYTVNEMPMGGELTTDQPPAIRLEYWGTAPVERVDLIRDQKRIHTFKGTGRHETFTCKDPTIAPGINAYYLRIRQVDGELAWSSPVFVNYTGEDHGAGDRKRQPAWNDDGQLEDWIGDPPANAAQYTEAALEELEYLAPGRFKELHPVKWIENSRGNYAVFLARDKQSPNGITRIRFYPEFNEPRLHLYPGIRDYGPIRK